MTTPAPTRAPLSVHLLLIAVQVAFGSFPTVGKIALAGLTPAGLAAARLALSVPILLAAAALIDGVRPKPRDLAMLALLALLGVVLNQVLFIVGLRYTTAVNAGILMTSIPVFTALFAAALGVERLGRRRAAGVAVAVVGAVVMVDPARAEMGAGTFAGNLLILGNCAAYGLFLVLQRPFLARLPPLSTIAYTFAAGAVVVVPWGAGDLINAIGVGRDPAVWWAVAYIVLVPSVFTYIANSWALKHASPTLVAAYTTLQPAVSALLASQLLGERVGLRELGGFALIAGGLSLVARARRPAAAPAPAPA